MKKTAEHRFDDTIRPAFENGSVALYHWTPTGTGINFGDEISPLVVQAVLAERSEGLSVCAPEPNRRRLLAIGSILHFARSGDVVWGTGLNGKVLPQNLNNLDSLDIRAVRGPLTRDYIVRSGLVCPEIYGDPGLLVGSLLGEQISSGDEEESATGRIIFIPNLNDEKYRDKQSLICGEDVQYVSPNTDPITIARAVSRAHLVVSSSLHGIIFADSLGIPCRPVLSAFESPFKYLDYFLSTDRGEARLALDVSDALRHARDLPPPKIDITQLKEAFPWDLIK